MLRTAWSLLLLTLLASAANAQRVTGTVVSDETGRPVAGAIVSAYAGRDTTAATLTRVDGGFTLAPPARRNLTLLVRAIGLQPVQIPLPAGKDTVVVVRMSRIAFRLAAVRVSELTSCSKTQTGTANIFDVWMEVTKALENTRLVRDSKKRTFEYVLYERVTYASSGIVRQLRNDTSSWTANRPFKVAAPKDLAADGYIIEDRPSFTNRLRTSGPALRYRAPDEMVLLDPSFQKSHCFWASHGEDANQGMIGVFFMPVSGIRINDIRGVFWLDSASYELKRLDYVYTQIKREDTQRIAAADSAATQGSPDQATGRGITPGLTNPEPGGILQFRRLEDGTFIIPDWAIFLNDTWKRDFRDGPPTATPNMLHETGGLVLRVSGGD